MSGGAARRGLLALILAAPLTTAACAAEPRGDPSDSGAPAAAVAADTFIPGFDAADSASQVLAAYLETVREGAPARPSQPLFTIGCGADTGVVHPVEMLAAWDITGRTPRGDTTVVRARTLTVAEEDAMGTTPPRYMAVQRSRDNEWEWDVVRDATGWHVCNGPRFGFVGNAGNTSWRPSSASHATARAAAESLWRSRRRGP